MRKNLFKSSGSYIDISPNTFDCLIVDESHRLNAKSGIFKNKGENQIKEIIEASKVSVFFIDENQMVMPKLSRAKRRVAGYARVSTDSDEQFTSFSAQTEYYKNLIIANPDWEFVHVYTDEGISGLNTRKRTGFKEMIDDALAGKIDLIVTKSVSRFARNTVDSLKTIRELKKAGTEVYFEKENIYTFDGIQREVD